MFEFNEGFKIIADETYNISNDGRRERIVLGRKTTEYGVMFVTWESIGTLQEDKSLRLDYFWGHYFEDSKSAYADYHRRLLAKYE